MPGRPSFERYLEAIALLGVCEEQLPDSSLREHIHDFLENEPWAYLSPKHAVRLKLARLPDIVMDPKLADDEMRIVAPDGRVLGVKNISV